MRNPRGILLVALCFLAGCGTASKPVPAPDVVRNYNGTASVGDFLTISIDSTASTITYKNYTTGDSSTVPYTVKADGTYTITDPSGNLLSAYEVPGFVMMVETAKAGSKHDTAALLTAVESAPASINTFAGRSFNYIQFRTAAGGTELGTVTIDGKGNVQHDGYWPFGVLTQPQDLFNGGSFAASSVQEDASGDFFTITESSGSQDFVFGTQSGFFAVDTENGAILGLPKASSKSFDPSYAGTYTALFYEKSDALMGPNNREDGTPSEGQATVTISASGVVSIADSKSTLASGKLVAVADTPYLYDGTQNMLSDPCYGLFTFRTSTANSQQDFFVSFENGAVIFSSFQTVLPIQPYATYTYFYGVGLK